MCRLELRNAEAGLDYSIRIGDYPLKSKSIRGDPFLVWGGTHLFRKCIGKVFVTLESHPYYEPKNAVRRAVLLVRVKPTKISEARYRAMVEDVRAAGTTSALARSDPGLLTKSDPPKRPIWPRASARPGLPSRSRRPARGWDTKTLRAFGADETASFIACPRARPVLRVGHSIGAQVGHFSRAPRVLITDPRLPGASIRGPLTLRKT